MQLSQGYEGESEELNGEQDVTFPQTPPPQETSPMGMPLVSEETSDALLTMPQALP